MLVQRGGLGPIQEVPVTCPRPAYACARSWQDYFVSILVYRTVTWISDLALNECTIRSARDAEGRAWWQLWTYVLRTDTGQPFYVGVPVNPHGPYLDVGPSGRHSWGLNPASERDWQISPSIDVVGDERPDGTREPSLWHETPTIVGVPDGERWITEAL